MHGNIPLVYLDNAATVQKPLAVLHAISEYYTKHNSNVHRGGHTLGSEATTLYENARTTVARFLNATTADEIVFTRGTTESINLVAHSWGSTNVVRGSVIVITEMEHHANIVPWHMLCQRTGATLRVIPVEEDGTISFENITLALTDDVVLFSMVHVSNTLGTVNNVKQWCALAREKNITTLVDGAQAVVHGGVDVVDIGCDFYVFSGHKLFAPTGIGVLYARLNVLEAMPPYQGGGSMISSVDFTHGITYNTVPVRFEAGTPNMEGAIGLAAAIDWFIHTHTPEVHQYQQHCSQLLHNVVSNIDGTRIVGKQPEKVGITSFVVHGVHAADIGVLLDEQGIAVRTGHHCTMPLMKRFGCTSTARASLALYNTTEEIEQFGAALEKAIRMLR